MKLFIECCKSKDKDSLYYVLKADLGYAVIMVTMEKNIICSIGDLKFSDLYKMKSGDKIQLGTLQRI